MIRLIQILVAFCVGTSFVPTTSAESHARYVIDQVVITLRDQPFGKGKVIHRLITGDAMTLTGRASESYVEVEIPNGLNGWVDSHYITSTPIAKVELKRKLEQSLEAQAETESALVQLSDDYRRLSEELSELRDNEGKPHEYDEQIDVLKQDIATAQEKTNRLDRRNKKLIESTQWQWYLVGAGTLAVGIIIGFAIPRRSRRSSWGNL